MTAPEELLARRLAAAAAAGGGSCEPIYSVVERELARLDLGGHVLDFGAGSGVLTRRLLASGRFRTVTAADLLPPADSLPGLRWLSLDLNEPLACLAPGSFEVLVAVEIIEHLENPRAVAREWFQLLRPGGTLLLTTPNNESWRSLIALVLRGHYVAFGDPCYPAHITALLRKDLTRILHEAGFAPPEFSFTDQGSVPGFPRLGWQSLSAGLLRGLRFSDNLLATARKPG